MVLLPLVIRRRPEPSEVILAGERNRHTTPQTRLSPGVGSLAAASRPPTLLAAWISSHVGLDIAVSRLGHRLNAISSGTELLAQSPYDRIDNVAADVRSSPDALDKILPPHYCRRVVDQLAEDLRLERREFNRASSHRDLAPIACEIQVVALGHSTRPGID